MESPRHIPPGLLCSGGERGEGRKDERKEGRKRKRGRGGGEKGGREGEKAEEREGRGERKREKGERVRERNIMSREKIREWGGAGFQETKHRECKDTMQNAHTLISRPILILLPVTTKLLTVVQGEGSLKSTVSLLLGLERVREDGVTDTLQGRGRRQVREQLHQQLSPSESAP